MIYKIKVWKLKKKNEHSMYKKITSFHDTKLYQLLPTKKYIK
jgi:hypothetical protein